MKCVQLILGKDFGDLRRRYQTNMDVYSLIMAWGLDLGETVKTVTRVMEAIVHRDFLDGIYSILEWAIPREGLDVREGIDDGEHEEFEKCIPFVRGPKGRFKERRRAKARIGWEALKLFMELMEVEAVIVQAKVKAKRMEGQELHHWKRKVMTGVLKGEPHPSSSH